MDKSKFPKDDQGSYVTLEILKNFQNGNAVQVHSVKTDTNDMVIPPEIIQDGDDANLDLFPNKFYFKREKDVKVIYLKNEDGEQKSILLRHLKEVCKAVCFFQMCVL